MIMELAQQEGLTISNYVRKLIHRDCVEKGIFEKGDETLFKLTDKNMVGIGPKL